VAKTQSLPTCRGQTPGIEGNDGKLFRVVYVWVAREEAVPNCPECRTPYRKATDCPNYPLLGYTADCVEKHIPDLGQREPEICRTKPQVVVAL
jgi:hypothetical protein